MVSQSGNMGVQLLSFAVKQGIGIRAFCGSGNEAMLTIEDFLDCFAVDTLTKTVMLYMESVNDGPRFFRSARRLTQKKPVILLKGGESRAGNKAAASHTGAMSSDSRVFNALCHQAGIIKVDGPMDLLDLAAAFDAVPLPKGNRVAVMTLGGGWGVITADLCSRYGLEVPDLSPELVEYMDSMLPPYWSRSNPIDLVGERDLSLPVKTLEALLSWDGCDAVINLGVMGRRIFVRRYAEAVGEIDPAYSKESIAQADEMLANFEREYTETIASLMTQYNKPIYGVSLEFDAQDKTVVEVKNCPFKTIFYQTPENAVKVCSKMYQYYNMLKRH
jgi:acyl-CoA synthetase (NDP forming)